MRKLSKQLLIDFDQLSNTIFNFGECFGSLHHLSSTFNKNINIGKVKSNIILLYY